LSVPFASVEEDPSIPLSPGVEKGMTNREENKTEERNRCSVISGQMQMLSTMEQHVRTENLAHRPGADMLCPASHMYSVPGLLLDLAWNRRTCVHEGLVLGDWHSLPSDQIV
jgi:hypothetical protein